MKEFFFKFDDDSDWLISWAVWAVDGADLWPWSGPRPAVPGLLLPDQSGDSPGGHQ